MPEPGVVVLENPLVDKYPTSDPQVIALLARADKASMHFGVDRYRSLFDGDAFMS